MVWFKVDDTFHDHPKARGVPLNAIGLWTFAGSHASRQLTDGWVADWFVKQFPQGLKLARQLVDEGLWEVADRDGKRGWVFHDWAEMQPTAASVKARRQAESNRQKLYRDAALREAIQRRDDNRCRYCGHRVSFLDRRSPAGGTYDHVDPKGDTSLRNCVVCCRKCNSYKGHRTPKQAGMELLPPGAPPPAVSTAVSTAETSSDLPSEQGAEGVTCWTPKGRAGSGTGRAGLEDEPDSISYDPNDYALADVSSDT